MNRVEAREDNSEVRVEPLKSFISRRSFLGTSLAVGIGTIGVGLFKASNAPPGTYRLKAKAGLDFPLGTFLLEGPSLVLTLHVEREWDGAKACVSLRIKDPPSNRVRKAEDHLNEAIGKLFRLRIK